MAPMIGPGAQDQRPQRCGHTEAGVLPGQGGSRSVSPRPPGRGCSPLGLRLSCGL